MGRGGLVLLRPRWRTTLGTACVCCPDPPCGTRLPLDMHSSDHSPIVNCVWRCAQAQACGAQLMGRVERMAERSAFAS